MTRSAAYPPRLTEIPARNPVPVSASEPPPTQSLVGTTAVSVGGGTTSSESVPSLEQAAGAGFTTLTACFPVGSAPFATVTVSVVQVSTLATSPAIGVQPEAVGVNVREPILTTGRAVVAPVVMVRKPAPSIVIASASPASQTTPGLTALTVGGGTTASLIVSPVTQSAGGGFCTVTAWTPSARSPFGMVSVSFLQLSVGFFGSGTGAHSETMAAKLFPPMLTVGVAPSTWRKPLPVSVRRLSPCAVQMSSGVTASSRGLGTIVSVTASVLWQPTGAGFSTRIS
ncbi:MAG: hypothetical protein ACOY3Y_20670 [Acidobacteriota bacterium]